MTTLERPAPPAVRAFGSIAETFDERFSAWASVTAQRAAVRRELLRTFPERSRLLELGGGTGVDAIFMARHGREVMLTDGSREMVLRAASNVRAAGVTGVRSQVLIAEDIESFAASCRAAGTEPFDGAYSNFAALNCVADLSAVGRGLAQLIRPGGHVVLVMFGAMCVGEVVVQLLRGDTRAAFRRFRRGAAPARLAGEHFEVWYPKVQEIAGAFAPHFTLQRTRGVGVFVPPSAAEPGISKHLRVLGLLEKLDRVAAGPLARFADHVLLVLERKPA